MENLSNKSRRNFILNAAKGSALVSLGLSGMSEILVSCNSAKKIATTASFATGFDQQPLPYRYDALENVIDAQTMEIHYSKHAAGYSKALKEAAQAEGIDTLKPVENVLTQINKNSSLKLRNNAGGHYNHELFWKSMRPKNPENKPSGKLLEAVEKTFSSFANFKSQYSEAGKARFGSGWAWLYTDENKNLKIGSTPNQDNPLMPVSDIKGFPILGLDVWEHAYYLKYQNKRADYIDNWWSVVNWNYIQQRFDNI